MTFLYLFELIALIERCTSQTMGLTVRDVRLGNGLAEQQVAAGTLIAYATQPGHVAYDGIGNNGYFTEALLAELRALPEHDIELLLRDVRVRVLRATGKLPNKSQLPWVHTSLLGPFAFCASPDATPSQTADDQRLKWSRDEWEQLQFCEDIKQLQRFAGHAHPYYAGEAQACIAELKEDRARRRRNPRLRRFALQQMSMAN